MYFFDSSAIIEILKDNKEVINRYGENQPITINLAYGEIYYYCIKSNITKDEFRELALELVEYDLEDIEKAMELLYKRKKENKNFGFIDSLIYIIANKIGAILVTKDLGFKGLPNVEVIS